MKELKMYIDGAWVEATSGKRRNIIDPSCNTVIATAQEAAGKDAETAIQAAVRAFRPESEWRRMTVAQRCSLLIKTAELLEERAEEISRIECKNTGRVYNEVRYDDVYAASGAFRYYAGIASELQGSTADGNGGVISMTTYEPLGVCAIIVPWNYPLGTAGARIAAALAAGNTIVVKPASLTPMTAEMLFRIFDEVGFPKGVVNLITGPGEEIGQVLSESRDVKKIAFTGGTVTGKSIIQKSATSVKKLSMELGGKSPFIIFDDADLEIAAENALFGIFLSQGQVCIAGSRLLVQDTVYDRVIEILKKITAKIRIGMPFDEKANFGPMISEGHMQSVLEYIRIGKEEGANLLTGGNRITEGDFGKGFFIEPTIFTDCRQDMRIVQEEIFGPVLTVQKFSTEKEAIEMANGGIYGLAGAVFTNDIGRALRVCSSVDTGVLYVNAYMIGNKGVPISPHRESGTGIVGGVEGLKEFAVLKQINIKLNAEATGWFS